MSNNNNNNTLNNITNDIVKQSTIYLTFYLLVNMTKINGLPQIQISWIISLLIGYIFYHLVLIKFIPMLN